MILWQFFFAASVYSCALVGDLEWSPSLLEGAAHEPGYYNSSHVPHRLSFSLLCV